MGHPVSTYEKSTEETRGVHISSNVTVDSEMVRLESLQVSKLCPQEWPGAEWAPGSQLLLQVE